MLAALASFVFVVFSAFSTIAYLSYEKRDLMANARPMQVSDTAMQYFVMREFI